jgi:5-(carboxyamino)imidazole ribonucleotide synthase
MLGGGQLGRMSMLAGRRMGYRFIVLDPSADCCAAAVADRHIATAFDDVDGLRALAASVSGITLEFENIPALALDTLQPLVPVHPGRRALEICQNRLREKRFLAAAGLPHAAFAEVASLEQLEAAVAQIGCPAVLKTADFGYDGKGQVKLGGGEDLAAVWGAFAGQRAVLESWVDFSAEYSIICARNSHGDRSFYPLIHNTHRNHILFTSVSPVGLDPRLEAEAREIGEVIVEQLELVGLVAVELFLTTAGWVVNEMAPRPHNSGHLTLEAGLTSQFEQHIRMVCGLPAGDTTLAQPACMLNLLGDIWRAGPPDFAAILADPLCKLHLYDKGEPRVGRKMGHLTFLGADPQDCLRRALEADRRLQEISA